MNQLAAGLLVFAALAAAVPAAAPYAAAPPAPSAGAVTLATQLGTVVLQSVAAARSVQQHEREVIALAGDLVGAGDDLAAQQRSLDAVRTRAAIVLAALERLAHAPPEAALLTPQQPIDRIRSGIVLAAIVPSLAKEAHRLIARQQELAAQHAELVKKQGELAAARQALGKSRDALRALIASRDELRQQILHEAAASDPHALQLGTAAAGLSDLIKQADALFDTRDRALRQRAGRAKGTATPDPTKPAGLRAMTAQTALLSPVAGPIVRHFGDTDEDGKQNRGLAIDVISGGTVVAPFDGRVEYAGPFGDSGPILIIGHGGGYHSVLAGLGRVDAAIGEWVVAGEPIGTMPAAAKSDESVTINFELRQNGRAIDPQPFLGGRGASTADHRVNE